MADQAEPPLWDDEAFRRRVSDLAAVRGTNPTEVAARAGLSPSYCYKTVGVNGRSIEALLRLAMALGVEVGELLTVRSEYTFLVSGAGAKRARRKRAV